MQASDEGKKKWPFMTTTEKIERITELENTRKGTIDELFETIEIWINAFVEDSSFMPIDSIVDCIMQKEEIRGYLELVPKKEGMKEIKDTISDALRAYIEKKEGN